MYRLKKEPKERDSNMLRKSLISIALLIGGFTIGFLLGGPTTAPTPPATVPPSTPPQVVVVTQQPEQPQLTDEQKGSSVFSEGSYRYNDNTPDSYVFKIVDKESHTICYTAESKRYGHGLAISCLKYDPAEDKKEDTKDKHD